MKDFAVMLKGFPRETGKEASRHSRMLDCWSLGVELGRLKVIVRRLFARPQGWILSFPRKVMIISNAAFRSRLKVSTNWGLHLLGL